ncbi:hypothetical protein FQN49_005090 [Arthroderma sp. PD_2]|nr:hypothetical protein FQN49_005090 [Arthroderma sp. PD_2]
MDKPGSSTGMVVDELYFALPPAAIHHQQQQQQQQQQQSPLSPTSPEVTPADSRLRQRSNKRPAEFSLPPPPTRTRKIIQVKPKPVPASPAKANKEEDEDEEDEEEVPATGGKKRGSAATAAGRKIARRTAHSLIERRRRSKMNQEFATLKDMIPACRGHEMHKLAILQASIEYVNYLESCVKDLKVANRRDDTPTSPAWQPSVPLDSTSSTYSVSPDIDPLSTSTMPSPAQSARDCSSRASFEIIPMVLPSPAIQPARQQQHARTYSMSTSTTTSPLLVPQGGRGDDVAVQDADMDREATAALLMLTNDRRHSSNTMPSPTIWPEGAKRKMGMSVHDLLTH